MSPGLEVVVIVAAIGVGAFVKGATGGGLPLLAIPVMAVFIGVERAVVVMAVPGVVSNGWLVWTHRETARQTRDLPVLLAACIVGTAVGTVLLEWLPGRVLSATLAAMIITYIVVSTARPGFSFPPRVTRFTSPPVGLIAGGLQGSTGISGPLLSTYLHGYHLTQRAYVFSLGALFLVGAMVQVVTLALVGLYTGNRFLESVLVLVPILALMPLGSKAARRLSPQAFRKVVLVLLAASAFTLIYDALVGSA